MFTRSISDIMKLLASRSRTHRAQKKLSQQQLAAHSGVSLGSVKRFESTGKISLESLLKISVVLGCINEFETLMEVKDTPRTIDDLFKQ